MRWTCRACGDEVEAVRGYELTAAARHAREARHKRAGLTAPGAERPAPRDQDITAAPRGIQGGGDSGTGLRLAGLACLALVITGVAMSGANVERHPCEPPYEYPSKPAQVWCHDPAKEKAFHDGITLAMVGTVGGVGVFVWRGIRSARRQTG